MIEEMIYQNKMACKKQNISSIDAGHGIFILNKKKELVFADSMARKKLKLESKNVRIYPIIENGEVILYFGFIDKERIKDKILREEIAHYFFNPIAIAKGYLSLLEEELGENLKIRKVKEAIERIENVVRNIVMNGEIRE